jgi:CubicO group peptidase (beta-lactamase class C family)
MVVFMYACSSASKKKEGDRTITIEGKPIEMIELPKAGSIDPAAANEIAQSIGQYVDQFLVPSGYMGGILVAWKGNVIYEKYIGNGLYNNGNMVALQDTNAIHIASTTKTFTAHLILLLYQKGLLNLTDTLQNFFPQLPYPGITVFNLLTHRSGLPKYDYFLDEVNARPTHMVTNAEVIGFMAEKKPPVYLAPNKGFQYNNTNYLLLASIAEKVTGKPFPTLIKDEIFAPLAMNHSYVATVADTNTCIMSLDRKGAKYKYTELDGTYGDKNIYTTPKDMLRWHMYLQHKNRLRKSLMDSCYIGYSNEKPGMRNYGYGFRMFNLDNKKQIIFHNGYWHGNNSSFTRLLNEDVVIISTGNKYCRQGYGVMSFTGFFGDYLGFEQELEAERKAADSAKMDPQEILLNKFIKEQIKPKNKTLIKDSVQFIKLRLDSLRRDSIRKDSLLRVKKMRKDSIRS